MEKDPINLTRNATWYVLNKTGMASLAKSAICALVPSQQVKDLLSSQAERLKRREAIILQGVGELELQYQKGLITLDDASREQLWAAAKSGANGVRFSDLFDPHVAELLEESTPGEFIHNKD